MNGRDIEKHLTVGRPVLLTIHKTRTEATRINSTIRGWETGARVLVDWPEDEDQLVLLRQCPECTVEFLRDGRACAYAARFIDYGNSRHPIVCLTWPDTMEVVELRKHERARILAPCEVLAPGGKRVQSEIRDISVGGCRISCPIEVIRDEEVRLWFTLQKGMYFERVKAIVRNSTAVGSAHILGCQFLDLDARGKHAIEFVVATTGEQQRHSEGAGKRVLILEEDPSVVERLRGPLEGAGFRVDVAPGLVDAFCCLRMSSPNAVIVELAQPELPGTEICRAPSEPRAVLNRSPWLSMATTSPTSERRPCKQAPMCISPSPTM